MKILNFKKDKQAVIWISTIVYTLIGLSLIALLLAVVNPRVKELKDSFVIKQTIIAMGDFDDVVLDILKAAGNKRYYELYLSRGDFKFDCNQDVIEWTLDKSKAKASEPGVIYLHGGIQVLTKEDNSDYTISLKTNYSRINMTCGEDESDAEIVLNPASVPYKLFVENKGKDTNPTEPRTIINIVTG